MIFKKIKKNKGFVLLFAVTLAAIFLSIALGVGEIALKENNFSTSAVDTNNAFFAADTGTECALYYDDPNGNGTGTIFTDPSTPQMTCDGATFNATEPSPSVWNFSITGLGSNSHSCVVVKIDKNSADIPANATAVVTADGYNLTGTTCATPPQNAVDRQLVTTY